MRRLAAFVCLIWLGACAASEAPSAADLPLSPGNAALGLRYAEQNCASCHAIGPSENWSPVAGATSFDTIANTPGMTRIALNAWLHSPHPSMPQLIVDPEHIDDLAAYLDTLKR